MTTAAMVAALLLALTPAPGACRGECPKPTCDLGEYLAVGGELGTLTPRHGIVLFFDPPDTSRGFTYVATLERWKRLAAACHAKELGR